MAHGQPGLVDLVGAFTDQATDIVGFLVFLLLAGWGVRRHWLWLAPVLVLAADQLLHAAAGDPHPGIIEVAVRLAGAGVEAWVAYELVRLARGLWRLAVYAAKRVGPLLLRQRR